MAMTYWRRRFLALAIGLGLLSLIGWAFSGVLGASGAGASAASDGARASHGHGVNAGPTGSGASGPRSLARPGTMPSASAPASPQPSAPAAPGQAAPGREIVSPPTQAADAAPRLVRACKPGAVVLSLFTGQDSYNQAQLPEFDVDVVSTSARTCAFNVGPKQLSLVVRARGKRVWGSADCVTGRGRLATDLARGVPAIVPISWDLQTSARGCQGTSSRAPAGNYTASASDGGVASNSVTFEVRS